MTLEEHIAAAANVELGECHEWCDSVICYETKDDGQFLTILPGKGTVQITDGNGGIFREYKISKITLE